MKVLRDRPPEELEAFHADIRARYEAFRARGLSLDMTRGKPSTAQLDLSNALLRLPDNIDHQLADGTDARNYGGSPQGIPEARELFSTMIGAPPEQIIIANNSSLAVMHDCIVYALLKGVPGGSRPWREEEGITFICPVPGYDRHFAILEEFGIRMVTVPMTGEGPDMDAVEDLAADPSVKGMWCVPKYSNPTGDVYSDETVHRLAAMKTGAPDFRLFWDNAYALHNLTLPRREIANILEACAKAGHADRPFLFCSTSKITFGGAGLALFAASPENVAWLLARLKQRTIGPDKLNQLRHLRYLRNREGLEALMERHRALLAPKFEMVHSTFERLLGGTGAATWTRPEGGYFISVDVREGCARRIIALAGDAGVKLTPGGATFPYGKDPDDRNIRIAPSYPDLPDLEAASEGIALSILLGVSEALLAAAGPGRAARQA